MSNFPNYYKILNVPENATIEEIRDAYRREALQYHPDRHAGDSDISQEEATSRFQEIADAYYTLSDQTRRKAYDLARKEHGGWGPVGADAKEVFGDSFDELLKPEVENNWPFWQPLGLVSGATLGFIIGSVPGAVIGAYGGNKLGAVRDAKGVSVYEAFSKLPADNRTKIIQALFAKMVTSGLNSVSR